jgi:hypothetical protein
MSKKLDDQLSEHLKQAENHLISAVKLFMENKTLSRRTGYFTGLVRAQELITMLYREELVRIRGSKRVKSRV